MDKRINVTMSSMPPFEEYVEEIRGLWDSRWLSNRGAKSVEFENMLRERLGTPNVWLFANGHVALEIALQALDLRGEVITTPYTHCSTTHAIVRNGLKPVFCDVEEDYYTINPELIEEKITEDTCAIVSTHVYGFLCDVDAIKEIADRHGLKVVYDAAHAFGVERGGVSAANFGDAAMFSCHATKVFHTIEGGIVAYSDEALFEKMKYLVNFGFTGPEDIDYVGTNARMNEFEAAMGICNLRHLDDDIARRKEAGERYRERLSGLPGVRLFDVPMGVKWNYAYFPVIFDGPRDRDQVKADLEAENVFPRKYFYPTIDESAIYAAEYADPEGLPVSHWASRHVLTLPMSSELTREDVDRICDAIVRGGALNRRSRLSRENENHENGSGDNVSGCAGSASGCSHLRLRAGACRVAALRLPDHAGEDVSASRRRYEICRTARLAGTSRRTSAARRATQTSSGNAHVR